MAQRFLLPPALHFREFLGQVRLHGRKTAELVDLTVKMEQVILDLEHEAELAMGSAQGEAGEGNSAQRYREWALVYKERISILRPMLSAIKEEIANRGK